MGQQDIQLSCSADNQTLTRVKETVLVDLELEQGSITLTDISDLGKYLCITNSTIVSVHYITTGEHSSPNCL